LTAHAATCVTLSPAQADGLSAFGESEITLMNVRSRFLTRRAPT